MCKFNNDSAQAFNAQFQHDINGQSTEFVFHRFVNRWFLLITQYGKLPNMYTVEFDVRRNDPTAEFVGPIDHPEFHISVPITVKCLFGADKDDVRSGIQFLVNKSNLNKCPTEFTIGLGLKEINGPNLNAVVNVLNQIIPGH